MNNEIILGLLGTLFCTTLIGLAYILQKQQLSFIRDTLAKQDDLVKYALLAAQAKNATELSEVTEKAARSKLERDALMDELERFNKANDAVESKQALSYQPTYVVDIDGNKHNMQDLEVIW